MDPTLNPRCRFHVPAKWISFQSGSAQSHYVPDVHVQTGTNGSFSSYKVGTTHLFKHHPASFFNHATNRCSCDPLDFFKQIYSFLLEMCNHQQQNPNK